MDKQKLHELRVFAAETVWKRSKVIASRGFGHVGGSMSMADAMAVLYGEVMHIDPKNPRWEDRDWFVLSKGTRRPGYVCDARPQGILPDGERVHAQSAAHQLPVPYRPYQDPRC